MAIEFTIILHEPGEGDVERCRALLDRHRDLDLGLVDAAMMATADRLRTERVRVDDVGTGGATIRSCASTRPGTFTADGYHRCMRAGIH